MIDMDAAAFEQLVIDELDQLPDDMVDGLDNVVFVVEDRPEDGSLDLLGLYDGWALTERDRYGVGELPDRIIVYREPHLRALRRRGRAARRGAHDARARDRALLRHRRRPPARTGVGMTIVVDDPRLDEETRPAQGGADARRPWQTVVWDDPVNLMSYVTHVFREYFGFPEPNAERLMLAVHHDGHAVVAEGAREQMELHAQAMHDYGLWATVRQAPQ